MPSKKRSRRETGSSSTSNDIDISSSPSSSPRNSTNQQPQDRRVRSNTNGRNRNQLSSTSSSESPPSTHSGETHSSTSSSSSDSSTNSNLSTNTTGTSTGGLTLDDVMQHDIQGGVWQPVHNGRQFDGGSSDGESETECVLHEEELNERQGIEDNVLDGTPNDNVASSMPDSKDEFIKPDNNVYVSLPDNLSQVEYEDMINAGEVPVGWKKEFYKRRRKKVGNSMVIQDQFTLATGATVVPKNEDNDGKRSINYESVGNAVYHYGCKVKTGSNFAGKCEIPEDSDEPFIPTPSPDILDIEMLKELGLTRKTMYDPLWFIFLLLPTVNITLESGKKLQGFFDKVMQFTNMYAVTPKSSGGLGWTSATSSKNWKNRTLEDIIHFFFIVVHDGALGGSDGNIAKRWVEWLDAPRGERQCCTSGSTVISPPNKYSNPCCSTRIRATMKQSTFFLIKRALKTNDNRSTESKKYQNDGTTISESYNPASKFWLIYKLLVNNTIAITEKASDSVTCDENSYWFSGYGPPGAGMVGIIDNKPGGNRGGQNVVFKSSTKFPRTYAIVPRMRLHHGRLATQWGCSEMLQGLRILRRLQEYKEIVPVDSPDGQKAVAAAQSAQDAEAEAAGAPQSNLGNSNGNNQSSSSSSSSSSTSSTSSSSSSSSSTSTSSTSSSSSTSTSSTSSTSSTQITNSTIFTPGDLVAVQINSSAEGIVLGKVVRFENSTLKWVVNEVQQDETTTTISHTVDVKMIRKLEAPSTFSLDEPVNALYPGTETFYPAHIKGPIQSADSDETKKIVLVAFVGDGVDQYFEIETKSVDCNFVYNPEKNGNVTHLPPPVPNTPPNSNNDNDQINNQIDDLTYFQCFKCKTKFPTMRACSGKHNAHDEDCERYDKDLILSASHRITEWEKLQKQLHVIQNEGQRSRFKKKWIKKNWEQDGLEDTPPYSDPLTWPEMWFEKGLVRRSIFDSPPLIGADNFFSGPQTWKPIHAVGWGYIGTTNRARLVFAKNTLHCGKVKPELTKLDRMMPPITVTLDDFPNFVHCSFLSTGPTNIVGVNAFPTVTTYTQQKQRGRGEKKRIWDIEMNEPRKMYLTRYGVIDRIDARLRRLKLKLLSRRYHLAAMLNGFGLAIVDAFNIYRDLAEGNYGNEFKVEKLQSQEDWVMSASVDGMNYSSLNERYPGDGSTRRVKQSSKKKRRRSNNNNNEGSSNDDSDNDDNGNGSTGYAKRRAAKDAKIKVRMNAMANNMSQLHGHWSITKTKTTSPRECHFCGGYTYKSCAICLVPLCTSSIRATKQKTSKKSKTLSSRSDCHHNYHNPALAGLAKFDSSTSKFKYNAKKIKERLKQQQKKN